MHAQAHYEPPLAGSATAGQQFYKSVSLALAIIFAAVGILFLTTPEGIYNLFNTLSRPLNLVESSAREPGFYRVLAIAYMYIVSSLAFQMYRQPERREFLWLLVNAKSASSIISFLFFLFVHPYLIFITNGIVDGAIACGLIVLHAKTKGDLQ